MYPVTDVVSLVVRMGTLHILYQIQMELCHYHHFMKKILSSYQIDVTCQPLPCKFPSVIETVFNCSIFREQDGKCSGAKFPNNSQSCAPEDLIIDTSIVSRSLVQDFGFICDQYDQDFKNKQFLVNKI